MLSFEEEVDELLFRSIEVTSDASQQPSNLLPRRIIEPQASARGCQLCIPHQDDNHELLDMTEILNRIGDHEDVDMDTDQEVLARLKTLVTSNVALTDTKKVRGHGVRGVHRNGC